MTSPNVDKHRSYWQFESNLSFLLLVTERARNPLKCLKKQLQRINRLPETTSDQG